MSVLPKLLSGYGELRIISGYLEVLKKNAYGLWAFGISRDGSIAPLLVATMENCTV
jgi:hypothetical protein